ncbi:hypothetical protein JXL19_09390 [bacterium]|nr:hypothetical protein [bacterium]
MSLFISFIDNMVYKKNLKGDKLKYFLGILVLSFFIAWQVGQASGEGHRLKDPVKIHADGKPIKMLGGSFVTVCDWDNDGKKDLIVNDGNIGSFYIYLNQGSDSQPEFKEASSLKAGGSVILGC